MGSIPSSGKIFCEDQFEILRKVGSMRAPGSMPPRPNQKATVMVSCQWKIVVLCSLALLVVGTRAHTDQGLSVSLLVPDTISVGEPIIAAFKFENHSTQALAINPGENFVTNFVFDVIVPNGQHRTVHPQPPEGLSEAPANQAVKPGAIHVQDIVLDEWVEFREPGAYSVWVTYVGPIRAGAAGSPKAAQLKTQAVTIKVLPRDAQKLSKRCEELTRQAAGQYTNSARMAAKALTFVRDPIVLPFLVQLSDDVLKEIQALKAIARLGTPEARMALERLAADGTRPARARTAKSLLATIGKG